MIISLFEDKTTGYSLIKHILLRCFLKTTRKFGEYEYKQTQYNMDHVIYHEMCSFAMIIQRKEITFNWGS